MTSVHRCEHALLGSSAAGVGGFLFHAGPVYQGGAAAMLAAQPVGTWTGVGGLTLLLTALLSIPARPPERHRQREIVAVLSVFGTMAVVFGIIDRPPGATLGWAMIVISVLAAVQTALALLAATSTVARVTTGPRSNPSTAQPHRDAPPAAFPAHGFDAGVISDSAVGYGRPDAVASGSQLTPRAAPFVPVVSPAPTGAQPAQQSAAHEPGWRGRAQPTVRHTGDAGGNSSGGAVSGQ